MPADNSGGVPARMRYRKTGSRMIRRRVSRRLCVLSYSYFAPVFRVVVVVFLLRSAVFRREEAAVRLITGYHFTLSLVPPSTWSMIPDEQHAHNNSTDDRRTGGQAGIYRADERSGRASTVQKLYTKKKELFVLVSPSCDYYYECIYVCIWRSCIVVLCIKHTHAQAQHTLTLCSRLRLRCAVLP